MRFTVMLFASAAFVVCAQVPGTPEFFETKVRPVLANNCFGCHTNTAMGGLRVDSGDALMKGGKRGPSIVPGDPGKSILIQAIQHTNSELKMPTGTKLKDQQIADLTEWVKSGAKWPEAAKSTQTAAKDGKFVIMPELRKFWSFVPLQNPAPPAVKDTKWAKTSIDKFILAKLESEGLKPAKPASRRDLIRRVTLDLTGLPPTFEEIEAFEKDSSPEAFTKVVDRLLASHHYGERWGRVWLDVARYGEDDYRSLDPMRRGFNPYPNAHVYRDWVIQAFNDDLPYDQFVRAQIAGDLTDPKTRYKTLPATGFLGLGPWYYDNGSTEVTRADERHDRVDAVTRGFLGLTVACARCHDHKYDPIPTADYYALAGVFGNTIYEEYPMAPKSVLDDFKKIEDHIDSKQKILGEMQNNFGNQLSQSLAFHVANYLQGVHEVVALKKEMANVVEARKLDFELLDRWVKYMEKPTTRYKNKEAWQALMKKPNGGSPQEARKLAEKFQEEVVAVMLARKELDDENKVIAAKALEGTKPKKRLNKPSAFVTNDDFCPGCDLQLKSLPEDQSSFWIEIFQRQLSDSDDPNAMMANGFRNMKPGVLMFRGWGLESRIGSESQAQMAAVRKDIEEARKKLDPYYPYLHGVKDSDKPKDLQLHHRGDPFNLGPEIPRHFLTVLSKNEPEPFKQGSGRAELAEAIIKEPLAARVIVNRIWKGHFDTGIVDSPSNFGMTGDRPSHPELLEYMASSFVKNGMSIKKLHREILLSSVYQMSTANDPVAAAKDSGNRLYWRANRKRLDAEQLRDSVLTVAGDLDVSLGGPSEDLNPAMKRRTVYGKISRYKLDQYLMTFDFPSPIISAEKRFTTTVPLQRLFLMNSDFMHLEAEKLAERVAKEPTNRERIRKVYRLALGRDATEQEITLGLEYLKTEPLREYEERKNQKPAEGEVGGPRRGRRPAAEGEAAPATAATDAAAAAKLAVTGPGSDAAPAVAAEASDGQVPTAAGDGPPPPPEAGLGMGMMGGMGRRGPGPGAPPVAKYEPTAWGRYAKVLLSSSEFLFIN
jgi:cytochrome c553